MGADISQSGLLARFAAWLGLGLGLGRKVMPPVERRNGPRLRRAFAAEIQDPDGLVPATGVDFHDQGVMLVSKRAWATGAILFLDLKSFRMMGFAEVRHCTSHKGNYAIGLQFCSPLMQREVGTWRIERVLYPAEA
jgi:hypothetical protein